VTVAGLTATSPTSFIVTPIITGLSPSTGSVGTTVIIAGTGFDTASANDIVKFNGTPAVVMSSTSTQIIATVPAGATTGPVTVTVAGQEAVSPINFTVN
jgi:uncharacterized protein (TIGR03437 family)